MPIQTLAELFLVASGYDKPDLLMHQVGGKYTSISTKQFVGDVHRLAKALQRAADIWCDQVIRPVRFGRHPLFVIGQR